MTRNSSKVSTPWSWRKEVAAIMPKRSLEESLNMIMYVDDAVKWWRKWTELQKVAVASGSWMLWTIGKPCSICLDGFWRDFWFRRHKSSIETFLIATIWNFFWKFFVKFAPVDECETTNDTSVSYSSNYHITYFTSIFLPTLLLRRNLKKYQAELMKHTVSRSWNNHHYWLSNNCHMPKQTKDKDSF